jgi:hypothetical protein
MLIASTNDRTNNDRNKLETYTIHCLPISRAPLPTCHSSDSMLTISIGWEIFIDNREQRDNVLHRTVLQLRWHALEHARSEIINLQSHRSKNSTYGKTKKRIRITSTDKSTAIEFEAVT